MSLSLYLLCRSAALRLLGHHTPLIHHLPCLLHCLVLLLFPPRCNRKTPLPLYLLQCLVLLLFPPRCNGKTHIPLYLLHCLELLLFSTPCNYQMWTPLCLLYSVSLSPSADDIHKTHLLLYLLHYSELLSAANLYTNQTPRFRCLSHCLVSLRSLCFGSKKTLLPLCTIHRLLFLQM